MATTTNYGWTTPDDTALVKDGASAIRTLGSSVDTTTKALNPSTTLGDVEYRSSTANTNTRLAIGTTGQVLTVAGGVPSWATPSAKVLQVVSATYATATTIATGTLTDTGLSLSITPTSATSKILIMVAQQVSHSRNGSESGVALRLMRDATVTYDISTGGFRGFYIGSTSISQGGLQGVINFNYLDNPATTSSITYKTQGRVYDASSSGTSSWNNVTSVITLMEIGA